MGATLDVGVWLKDGRPAVRFDCWLMSPGQATIWYGFILPTDGFGKIGQLDTGEWQLVVEVIYDFDDPTVVGTRVYQDIVLQPGEHRVERVELAHYATVQGRVTSEQIDLARRKVRVLAYAADGGNHRCYTEVDDRGDFALKGVPGGPHWIRAETIDGNPRLVTQTQLLVTARSDHSLDLHMQGAALSGTVVDARERAIAGANLAFLPADGTIPRHVPLKAVSDSDGAFALAGMASGTFTFEATADGFGQQEGLVQVGSVGDNAVLRIALADAALLRVAVLDDTGATMPRASVTAQADLAGARVRRPERTDRDGRQRFSTLAEGTYIVTAQAPGFFPGRARSDCRAGETTDITLRLRRPGDLLLRLKSADGQPLDGEPFDLIDEESGASATTWLAAGSIAVDTGGLYTGAHGLVTLRGLPAGRYSVLTFDREFAVEVMPGEQRERTLMRQP